MWKVYGGFGPLNADLALYIIMLNKTSESGCFNQILI